MIKWIFLLVQDIISFSVTLVKQEAETFKLFYFFENAFYE